MWRQRTGRPSTRTAVAAFSSASDLGLPQVPHEPETFNPKLYINTYTHIYIHIYIYYIYVYIDWRPSTRTGGAAFSSASDSGLPPVPREPETLNPELCSSYTSILGDV